MLAEGQPAPHVRPGGTRSGGAASGQHALADPTPAGRPRRRNPRSSPDVPASDSPIPGPTAASGQGGNGAAPAPGGPGIVAPGGGGGSDPGPGATPLPETPTPGQVNPRPVSVWKAEPTIDGRHVTVLISWWSGVPPCSVFDSVVIARDGSTISLTPLEGSAPGSADVACPAIAKETSTIVDLGELDPGTWTLQTSGDLAPITIKIR